MKNCAVICEYNPFHTGHKYQLDRIRELGAKNVLCVMSGSFVQSGLPAFCDKAIRAECALRAGADGVIELPAYFSASSAQYFAEGGVRIIAAIKDITHIAMGATAPRDAIMRLAELKRDDCPEYTSALKKNLAVGKSFGGACTAALCELYEKKYGESGGISSIVSEPNNMLCIEYISAANRLNADIEPLIIARIGATHGESVETDGFVSATAIRNGELSAMKKYIPYCFDGISRDVERHAADLSAYAKLALYAIRTAPVERISILHNCSEGMEYLLKKCADSATDLGDLVKSVSGARYPVKRIFRLICDLLLGIDESCDGREFVTRLLACKNVFDFSVLPEFVKTNNDDIKSAAEQNAAVKSMLRIDENAAALYNTLCGKSGGYYNYSLVKI